MFNLRVTNPLWERVPSYYIYCERDKTVTGEILDVFALMLAGSWDRVIKITADHTPFLSRPVELDTAMRKAIAGIMT